MTVLPAGIPNTAAPAAGKGLTLDLKGHIPLAVPHTPQWFPTARVYNSANIAIVTSTLTALTFNSERYDNNEIHDTGTNTGRLICRIPGVYAIAASIDWEPHATGSREVWIRLNGATYIATEKLPSTGAANGCSQTVATQYPLAIPNGVPDYLEVQVWQSSGGNLNVQASGNYSPDFMMTWVAPHPDSTT